MLVIYTKFTCSVAESSTKLNKMVNTRNGVNDSDGIIFLTFRHYLLVSENPSEGFFVCLFSRKY